MQQEIESSPDPAKAAEQSLQSFVESIHKDFGEFTTEALQKRASREWNDDADAALKRSLSKHSAISINNIWYEMYYITQI